VGAVVANRPRGEQAALESYGRNLGIAFQLIDDALDYSGTTEKLGKDVGDDFRERKITLPVVLSYRRGAQEERNFWKRTLEDGDQTDDDFGYAKKLMERHGAIADTIDRANHYGDIARDALAIFPNSALKDALLEAVDFCVARAY
jgi:octaprenyl-diphosphate synthase